MSKQNFGQLEPMNLLCDRWASTAWDWPARNCSPLGRMIRQAEGAGAPGATPPMPDDVLDLCVILAPKKMRLDQCYLLVHSAYITTGSAQQKADRLKMSRANYYIRWREALSELHGAMLERGWRVLHSDNHYVKATDTRKLALDRLHV